VDGLQRFLRRVGELLQRLEGGGKRARGVLPDLRDSQGEQQAGEGDGLAALQRGKQIRRGRRPHAFQP